MADTAKDNVDYRLLNNLSNLVICSHCLRTGKVTPIPQVITKSRRPRNLCPSCRDRLAPANVRKRLGTLLQFPKS